MKRFIHPAMFVALTFGCGQLALSQTLHLDNTHSSIEFSVRFMAVTEVTGRFEKFCGQVTLAEKSQVPTELSLFIDARSINTGLKMRDRDLVNDYLDCDQFPIIEFRSKHIALVKPGQLDVEGDLYLHGKTKAMNIQLNLLADKMNKEGGRELGWLMPRVKLSRADFDVMENTAGIGDTIAVHAAIRVRDLRPYRSAFDPGHPEVKASSFVAGNFTDGTVTVRLIPYTTHYFMAFDDDDWSWFSELKPTGPSGFKTTSFLVLLAVSPNRVELRQDGTTKILQRVVGK